MKTTRCNLPWFRGLARITGVLLAFALLAGAQAPQPRPLGLNEQIFTVSLLSPISTKNAKESDQIVARVSAPVQFEGAVIEGRVQKVTKAKSGDKAEIRFSFQTLTWRGQVYPIRAELTDVSNSKGVKNVDEEGVAVGKSSNKGRIIATLLGSAAGAAIGGAAAGGKGAAVGAGAGAAAGLLIGIKFTARGPNIEFAPGSQFILKVSDRATQ